MNEPGEVWVVFVDNGFDGITIDSIHATELAALRVLNLDYTNPLRALEVPFGADFMALARPRP